MKKTLFICFVLSLLCVNALAQSPAPVKEKESVTIPAGAVAGLEVVSLRARVAALELEINKLQTQLLSHEAEKAKKASADADKAAQEATLQLIEQHGVKREDLSKYDIKQGNDGTITLVLKKEPPAVKKE